MLTESTLAELRALINSAAAPDRRDDLEGALDDLQRTIAAQSLAIRNLTADLRNRRIGQEAMDALLPPGALNGLLERLGEARSSPFSLDQARRACAELADHAARASDVGEIAAAIVKVARAFL